MSAQKHRPGSLLGALLGTVAFSALAGILITVAVTPAIAVTGATVNSTVSVFDSLPDFIEIGKQPEQNRIFANSGKKKVQIATVFNQNREEVKWDEVSQNVKDAAVSGEDRRFYEHGGVDIMGVVRAAVKNVVGGSIQEGASTITQQLVKNIFVQQALDLPTVEEQQKAYNEAVDDTFERKLKEMKLAIAMEKKYSKDEILLAYLNIAGFGGNTYGIEAAAQRYYGTSAKKLSISQSASLIAIVQYPSLRSLDDPKHYKENQNRRDVIIRAMAADKKITSSEEARALKSKVSKGTVHLTDPKNGCIAAQKYSKYFCDYVLQNIKNLTSLGANAKERAANWKRGGYDIYTTLQLPLQNNAQQVSWNNAPANETVLKLGSATVSVEVGTGRILVMAQNKKFDDTEKGRGKAYTAVNFSTDRAYGGSSGFQPGSTYKVFTLLNWLQAGHGINESVNGSPRTVAQNSFKNSCSGTPQGAPWTFKNDDATAGQMTVATATRLSVNGAFVSMAQQLDLCGIKKTAESLGVHRADGGDLKDNPSSILGINEIAPLTMAAAYAGIASGGTYCAPIAVDSITDPNGKKLAGQEEDCAKKLDSDVANTAAFAMAAVINSGTATLSKTPDGIPEIGKTGTTDSSNQTWIVGATRKVSTAVWVGNIEGFYPLRAYVGNGVQGGLIRHNIWRETMIKVNQQYGGGAFPAPSPELLQGSGVKVPDLAGQTLKSAKSQLEAAGFTVVDGGSVDSGAEKGTVVRSDPAAGGTLSRGASITLYTSNGSEGEVPNVVGDGNNTFEQAQSLLQNAGFTNVTEKCLVAKPESPRLDHVIASSPSAGKSASRDARVVVTVGRATC